MDNVTSHDHGLNPRDKVKHPRLGVGQVERIKGDGTVEVRFQRASQTDVLYPDLLEKIEPSETSSQVASTKV